MPAEVILVRVQADGQTTPAPLKKDLSIIGRGTDCQIRIPAGDVSRHHCHVERTDGGVTIKDLDSRNGTFVNADRIEEHELEPGDVITVGQFVFVAQIDGEPGEFSASEKYTLGAKAIGPETAGAVAKPKDTKAEAGGRGSLMAAEGLGSGNLDDSSVVDFDFDFDDEEDDEQPPL
ncbi:MAG: FHA domain-containing protein [Planctomycetota bacterium]